MKATIHPGNLKGNVDIPSSKSVTHRVLIAAALSDGISTISRISSSKDIEATLGSLKNLGAIIREKDKNTFEIRGIAVPAYNATLNCNESGSTLRFLIPVAAALGTETLFIGRGRLPKRPISAYIRELPKKGITIKSEGGLPFQITGKLQPGNFMLEGDISSQYVTGLMFALPLLKGDSRIILSSPLQSKPYADLTINVLSKFGIEIEEKTDGYYIRGNQEYKPCNVEVEGDYSQAAFFYVANELGADIKLSNLSENSIQGDKMIVDITSNWDKKKRNGEDVFFDIDASSIPDLVPILTVLGSSGTKPSYIRNASRLKLKESDRLETSAKMVNSIGGKVEKTDDGLVIYPVDSFSGGQVDSFDDHRIVMSAAVAACFSTNDIIITGAEAVEKSYPTFFEDYKKLGGKVDGIYLEK